MRQIFPVHLDPVDIGQTYFSDRRVADGPRPWVVVNMVSSPDGATAVAGRSGGLGSEADHTAFHALRASADHIVVGAGTARAENYGPPAVDPAYAAGRAAAGLAPQPRLVLVSARARLDPTARVFSDPTNRPLVATVAGHGPDILDPLETVAEVVEVGDGQVDLRALFQHLGTLGARTVLVEGGPTLNGDLVADGLVDEWCLTMSTALVAGDSARAAHGSREADLDRSVMRLDRVIEADGTLLLRYVRT